MSATRRCLVVFLQFGTGPSELINTETKALTSVVMKRWGNFVHDHEPHAFVLHLSHLACLLCF